MYRVRESPSVSNAETIMARLVSSVISGHIIGHRADFLADLPTWWRRAGLAICLACTAMITTATVAANADEPQGVATSPDLLVGKIRELSDTTLGSLVRDRRSSFAMAILVRDGREQFERDYGYEDPASKTLLSPASHVDMNSVKKLFIAVAVAQLLDKGLIHSVDDPINLYLKHFKLPKAFGREITIRQVATHNEGFDFGEFGAETVGGLVTDPPRYFEQRFPGYFENTGQFSTYSGYGSLLLAYMVSETTGIPFNRYATDFIVRPLGMNDTWLGAPAAPDLHRIVPFQPKSPGNAVVGEALAPIDAILPSGQWISTAHDLGKFMIALLGPGGDQRVITQPMRDAIFRIYQSNGEGGSAHGLLFDVMRSGETTFFNHGGVGAGADCLLALEIKQATGLFFCYGAVHTRVIRDPAQYPPDYELIKSVMLRPFTACPIPGAGPACPRFPASPVWLPTWDQYLGFYVSYARHHHGPARLISLLYPNSVSVEKAERSLRFNGVDGFVEVAPGVFGNPNLLETFSFLRDPVEGKMVLSGSGRPTAYERPRLLDNPRVMPRALALLVLIAMSGGLIVLLPRYGLNAPVRIAVTAYGTVVGCGVAVLYGLHAMGDSYLHGVSWPLNTLRALAILAVPVCAILIVLAIRASRTRFSGIARIGRLHLYLICVSSVLLIVFLWSLDLISVERIT
jgi:CubicO group peptidase (beta-lactamase class C family)